MNHFNRSQYALHRFQVQIGCFQKTIHWRNLTLSIHIPRKTLEFGTTLWNSFCNLGARNMGKSVQSIRIKAKNWNSAKNSNSRLILFLTFLFIGLPVVAFILLWRNRRCGKQFGLHMVCGASTVGWGGLGGCVVWWGGCVFGFGVGLVVLFFFVVAVEDY